MILFNEKIKISRIDVFILKRKSINDFLVIKNADHILLKSPISLRKSSIF